MATFRKRLNDWSGKTGISVQLFAIGSASIANGSGTNLTETNASGGLFTGTVSQSLSGWYEYWIYKDSTPIYSGLVFCYGSTWDADIYPSTQGPALITVTVDDNNSDLVANAVVFAKVGSTIVAWGTTNSSGVVALYLQSGTYSLGVQAMQGYLPFSPISVTLPNVTSQTLTLTAVEIEPPSSPSLCAVRFSVLDNDTPIEGATVEVTLDKNSAVNTALEVAYKRTGTTNSSGYVDITLVQYGSFVMGGYYRVQVKDDNGKLLYEKRVKVPNQSTCYADDLIEV